MNLYMISYYNFFNLHLREIFAGLTGGLCLLIAGTWSGWTSPFLYKLETGGIPLNLTVNEESWVVSSLNFGSLISPIPTVYIMDILGRKKIFYIIAILYQLSWFLIIFSNGVYLLIISRFLAGLCEGICYTITSIYLSEIAKKQVKEVINRFFTVELVSGIILELFIGPLVSNLTVEIISLCIPVIFFLLVFYIPESPFYLVMKNKHDAAYKIMWWLRKSKEYDEKNEDEDIKSDIEIMNSQIQKDKERKNRWTELIDNKSTRRATIIVISLSVMDKFSGITTLLQYMSITLPRNKDGIIGPQQIMLFFAITLLITSIVCTIILDSLGRKPALLTSGIGCAIIQGIMAIYFYYDNGLDYECLDLRWIPYICIVIFPIFYQIGLGAMTRTLLDELFSPSVKSKAAAIVTTCFELSKFIINETFPIISDKYGAYFMFILFFITNISVVVFTQLFVIETKGKTYEEIQAILNS